MKSIKLVLGMSVLLATASARAVGDSPSSLENVRTRAPFLLDQPSLAAPAGAEPTGLLAAVNPSATDVDTPGSASSSDDLGYYALSGASGLAPTSAGTVVSLSSDQPKVSVPLPEPSSETSLYVLSGVAGLALVVLRRRTLA